MVYFWSYVSLVNISATLAMQKRVKLYLPSGSIGYSELDIKNLQDRTERS